MAICFHSGNASQLTCARRPTWAMTQVHISPPMRKTPDTADWRALIASFISEPLDTGCAGSITSAKRRMHASMRAHGARSFAVDREVAEPWQGVVRVPGNAEPLA